MPFQVFQPRGGGGNTLRPYPFKALIENSQSGVGKSSLQSKCPCDTGDLKYTASNFFSNDPGSVSKDGKLSVKVFSGSNLFTKFELKDPKAYSYVDNFDKLDKEKDKKSGVIKIFGLNRNIFIQDLFPKDYKGDETLKIWLTVCHASGQPETITNSDYSWGECSERSNDPLMAFVSYNTGQWPEPVTYRYIDKSSVPGRPRYEKRQIRSNVPIAEIDVSGNVVRQLTDSNLTLTDMAIQGLPAKYPLAIFSEHA